MLVAVAALALSAQVAGLAADDRVRFRMVRDASGAAAACPADDDVAQRVRDRIGSEPFTDGVDVRELRIGIGKDARGLVARVVLFAPNGTRLGVRVLHGDADCVSLADDIVLAAAIAIDPLLLVRKRPTVEPTGITAPTPSESNEATTNNNNARLDAPAAATTTTATLRVNAASGGGGGIPAPASVSGRALLLVATGVGIIATPSLRVQTSFDYGVLDIDAGLRFDLPSRYPAGDTGALLDVALVALDAAACFDWDYDASFGVRGCGGMEGGVVGAQGIGFAGDASPVTAPWWAVSARGMTVFRPWPDLPFSFVAGADVYSPLLRARFVDDTTRQVYAEPSLFGADVGLGVEIQIR